MLNTNINKISRKGKVLIAPLDWGLGHATRCVPIIKELLMQGFEVIIASEKAQAVLLSKEFPVIKIIPLSGYHIIYSTSKKGFYIKMLLQIPKIIAAIIYEHKWLKNTITQYDIDVVISDNRYGLFNKKLHTVFITHQLQIQTGNVFFNAIVKKINYFFIKKFNSCWIPDFKGENNLTSILSHPKKLPISDVVFIGPISRFTRLSIEKTIDVAIVISGPEPQRTAFEKIILKQIEHTALKIVLSRGLPMENNTLKLKNNNIIIYNHLDGDSLSKIIQSSNMVIARSGYSTVMDVAVLQQKAIFIPTPGQTEQEYLAEYLNSKNYCIVSNQIDFNLLKEIENANSFLLNHYPVEDIHLLKNTIAKL